MLREATMATHLRGARAICVFLIICLLKNVFAFKEHDFKVRIHCRKGLQSLLQPRAAM